MTVSAYQYDPFLDLTTLSENDPEFGSVGSVYELDISEERSWGPSATEDKKAEELTNYELFDKKQCAFSAVKDFQCIKGKGVYQAPENHYELLDSHLQPAGIAYLKHRHPGKYAEEHPIYKHLTQGATQSSAASASTHNGASNSNASSSTFQPNHTHFKVPTLPNSSVTSAASLANNSNTKRKPEEVPKEVKEESEPGSKRTCLTVPSLS